MSTVRAAVLPAAGAPIEIRELEPPDLAPGEALLRVTLADVCGTDVHLRHGRLAGVPYPIIPGHVSVGVVEEIRGEVRDVDGEPIREGDTATFFDVAETCHACHACLVAKAATRCPHRKVYGITYGVRDGLLGGWAERVHLRAGVEPLRVPEGLDARTWIAAGCGLPTAYHAVERAGVREGDTVLVAGSGPVGIQAVAVARAFGAERVLVTGAPEERLAIARRFGADETLDIRHVDPAERRQRVLDATGGRGADRVIEAAGAPDAVREALELVREGGVVVIAGHYTDAGEIAINPHLHLNRKHVDLRGCWGSEFRHFYRALRFLARASGSLPYDAMISRVYPLEEAQSALEDVEALSVVKAVLDPAR